MIYETEFEGKRNKLEFKNLLTNSCFICCWDREMVFQINFSDNLALLINENPFDLTAHVYFYNKETGEYKDIKNKKGEINKEDILLLMDESKIEFIEYTNKSSDHKKGEEFVREWLKNPNLQREIEKYSEHIVKYQNYKFDKNGVILENEEEMG